MNNIIGNYVNGNTIVVIHDDGTKERYIKDKEIPYPEFPESIDLKITNRCNLGCPMCAESSVKDGKHAELFDNKLFNTIHEHTELAIGGGNPLEHPELISFLMKMKKQKVICNITVNVNHFMEDYYQCTLKLLQDGDLIKGLGISIPDEIPDGFFSNLGKFNNVVIHTIAGYTPESVYRELMDCDINLLVLGYKSKGRGTVHCKSVDTNICLLGNNILDMHSHYRAIAFDNLAVEQLKLKDKLSEDEYNELYMGDDGEYTMYIDLVTNKYGKSSSHQLKPILDEDDTIYKLFHKVRSDKSDRLF